MNETRNLITTIALSMLIVLVWRYYFVTPPAIAPQNEQFVYNQNDLSTLPSRYIERVKDSREIVSETAPLRIKIESPTLDGSIYLRGARLDNLILKNYKESLSVSAKQVNLLNPYGGKDTYFAAFNWLSNDKGLELPTINTVWHTNSNTLTPEKPATLTWTNPQHITFILKISLDENYMFTVEQQAINSSGEKYNLYPYALLNRIMPNHTNKFVILHEGFIGSFDNTLSETSYEELVKEVKLSFNDKKTGWLGLVDKYWFASIIPQQNIFYDAYAKYDRIDSEHSQYRLEFIGQPFILEPGENAINRHHFYAGPKLEELLEVYEARYNLPLFEHAVDFGALYFLTKPIFKALQFLHTLVGNFGLAIILLTIIIKAALFPLAYRAYKSMSRMKLLQPTIQQIREMYKDDPTKLSQELMQLYKREKINPLSGCIPMLLQIPIFFALYKVLFVTIEMRHAPFFGWIKDLSAPDPTSIFNLFGIINWQPPEFLMIGAWPLIMGVTMYIQQRLSPEPADPIQAKMLKFLPVLFVFLFHSFPAGLVIYWAVNNTLSITQQYLMNRNS